MIKLMIVEVIKMCLLAMALNVHPIYKLIICANRDEFFSRPTKRPYYWEEVPNVWAGKDLLKGGTWMGVHRNGKVAAVTNVREYPNGLRGEAEYSRGKLVLDFLTTSVRVNEYLTQLELSETQFEGYNLIFGQKDEWFYMSNRAKKTKLKQGFHVVSNADLQTDWPKTVRMKEKFKIICQTNEQEQLFIELCMNMLRDDELFHDSELPDTGIGMKRERQLSSIFINGRTYGTRASTIILMDSEGRMKFVEQGYGPEGVKLKRIEKEWSQ
ncbi:NRDE family protein [Halalkalibacter alkalisediminis]|uniref:NRDE family protein n=1 Tax=Halalkalibacter alkalisediminis TaxID=935616 RepID=A0ABV6NI56_9BACI|nr:NRDE family protein [Halalkalibacter alkalisediminis]